MYHCLDVKTLQTVPPEQLFVQIDNTLARDKDVHGLPRTKTKPVSTGKVSPHT